MKALILAAGEGTRLRPLTLDRPKPMLPVAGRPVLEHLLALVQQEGIEEVAINLHYRPEGITAHFGDGRAFGVHITYAVEPRLLGSAGAAANFGRAYFDDTFLVLYGDVLTDLPLSALVRLHRARPNAAATLALYEVEDPSRAGMVELDADGRVTRFVEKPRPGQTTSTLANAGIYVLEPQVLDGIPPGQPWDFGHDVFPGLLAAGRPLYAHHLDGYILDIGSPERYAQANADADAGRFHSPASRPTREPRGAPC